MTTTSWSSAVSGDFNTASNWTAGVPAAGDTALITVKGTYTVTSSAANSVGILEMAKDATLDIADHKVAVTSGTGTGSLAGTIDITNETALVLGADATTTTFENAGTINVKSGTGTLNVNALLGVLGNVTLTGKGDVAMSGSDAIIGTNSSAATFTNDSTISGHGVIGDVADLHLSFVNGSKGVVDGSSTGLGIATDGGSVSNSGLMEATTGSGILTLLTAITQTAKGETKAATSGALVRLVNATVTGGKVSTVKGAFLSAPNGSSVINVTTPIANHGTIEADGGTLDVAGVVKNSGTLLAGGTATTSVLALQDAVTGGEAEIQDSGEIAFEGAASTAVTFDAGVTGTLDLFDALKFTGTVAGMSGNPDAAIELENMPFADGPSVNFDATKHLLTVTDPITGITDKIKIVGTGTFTKSAAFDGTTLISDPPASSAVAPATNAPLLLAQAMASFGAAGGVAGSDNGHLVENARATNFLSAPPHLHRG